mgnify:CR=1 FL=1
MPDFLPLITSATNYRLSIPFGDEVFAALVRWNSRDEAFYMDLREGDGTPVLLGMKLVLGGNLGVRKNHRFFSRNLLRVVDSSDEDRDAGYDDLNSRVWVMHMTFDEIVNGSPESQGSTP